MLRLLVFQVLKAVMLILLCGFAFAVVINGTFPSGKPYYTTMAEQRINKSMRIPPADRGASDATNSGTVSK